MATVEEAARSRTQKTRFYLGGAAESCGGAEKIAVMLSSAHKHSSSAYSLRYVTWSVTTVKEAARSRTQKTRFYLGDAAESCGGAEKIAEMLSSAKDILQVPIRCAI